MSGPGSTPAAVKVTFVVASLPVAGEGVLTVTVGATFVTLIVAESVELPAQPVLVSCMPTVCVAGPSRAAPADEAALNEGEAPDASVKVPPVVKSQPYTSVGSPLPEPESETLLPSATV